MNSKPSEQDTRIKFLVEKNIMTDEQIVNLFVSLKLKFNEFIFKWPDISINLASNYLSNAFLSMTQKFKYDLTNQNEFGGPHNHVKSICSCAENAKVLLLPTQVMIYSKNNNSKNDKIQKAYDSFKTKPFDVLTGIKKEYDWLFPEIEKIRIIRNSEYHHSTVWNDINNQVMFIDENKPALTMNYSELHIIGIHLSMAYLLLSNAQFLYFFLKSASLLFENIKNNKIKIEEYIDFENLLNEARPSEDDIKILKKLDIIIQSSIK